MRNFHLRLRRYKETGWKFLLKKIDFHSKSLLFIYIGIYDIITLTFNLIQVRTQYKLYEYRRVTHFQFQNYSTVSPLKMHITVHRTMKLFKLSESSPPLFHNKMAHSNRTQLFSLTSFTGIWIVHNSVFLSNMIRKR